MSNDGAHTASTVAALDTVLFRFAATEDEQFEGAVQRVLPRVLARLRECSAGGGGGGGGAGVTAVRDKIVEILAHVNKRLGALPHVMLPVEELVELYMSTLDSDTDDTLLANFCVLYVEQGLRRLPPGRRVQLAPRLLRGVASRRSASQRHAIFRVVVDSLGALDFELLARFVEARREGFEVQRSEAQGGGDEDDDEEEDEDAEVVDSGAASASVFASAEFPDYFAEFVLDTPERERDLSMFVSFLQDVLAYIPNASSTSTSSPSPSASSPASSSSSSPSPFPAVVPPCMSPAGVARVTNDGKITRTASEWKAVKLHTLHFLATGVLPSMKIFPLIVIAAASGEDAVARLGESVRRRMRDVDLEDATLLRQLMLLFVGQRDMKQLNLSKRRFPISTVGRLKLLALFSRSQAAADMGMLTVKVVANSFFSADTSARIIGAALQFLAWTLRFASDKAIAGGAGKLYYHSMLKLIDRDAMRSSSAADSRVTTQSRALAYNIIGQIATRLPSLFNTNTTAVEKMFKALESEKHRDVLQNIHEALTLMRPSIAAAKPAVLHSLQRTLLKLAQHPSDRLIRVTALQYSNHVLPFDNIPARFMALRMVADTAADVADEARAGLFPAKRRDAARLQAEPSDAARYPAFPDFVAYVVERLAFFESNESRGESLGGPRVTEAIIAFTLRCLLESAKAQNCSPTEYTAAPDVAESFASFRGVVEGALASSTAALQATAAKSLVELARCQPSAFAREYSARLDWVRDLLVTQSADTRFHMAKVLSLMATQLEPDAVIELAALLSSDVDNITSSGTSFQANAAGDAAILHGAILGMGVLVARALADPVTDDPADEEDGIFALCTARIAGALGSSRPQIVSAACQAIGCIGPHGAVPLPASFEHSASSHAVHLAQQLASVVKTQQRQHARVAENAAWALGRIAVGSRDADVLAAVLRKLVSLASVKHDEVHFAVGRALAEAASGLVTPPHEMWDEEAYLTVAGAASAESVDWDAVTTRDPLFEVELGRDLDEQVSSAGAQAPLDHVLDVILKKLLPHGSVVSRAAASTWLLCLARYTGSHPLFLQRAGDIQQAFLAALTESSQFIQEVASKGLALVYNLGTPAMQAELMQSLVQTFSTGKRRVMQDTQVLVDADKGEFSTYKELCSVARDMGQPQLVYKFLDLASHHSIWNSKLGAAFSLSSIASASELLGAQLDALIPRLYRYQFDPNEKIKATMKQLWGNLVADPQTAVTEHFDAIVDDLIANTASRQWRNREASCLALCDLITGRDFEQLERVFESLWTVAFRTMDDIKDSVRKTGVIYAVSLSKLAERLCDPTYTSRLIVPKVLGVVIPVLLKHGITARAKEVQGISIELLLKVIKKGGIHLKPHLPELIKTLLEGLSSMEPAVLSYLQFHTAAWDMTPEQMEQVRISLAKSSPLVGALDSCRQVIDADDLPQLVPVLTTLLTTGVGLNTLNATAKFVADLATGTETMEVSAASLGSSAPGPAKTVARALTSYGKQLLTALQHGLLDQSPSIRKAYSNAIGAVAKVAKRKRVAKVVAHTIELYMSDNSLEERAVSAITCNAIVTKASDKARRTAEQLAPVAFLGMHDPDKDTAEAWLQTWQDLVPGLTTGVVRHLDAIVALMVQVITENASWTLKRGALVAINKAIQQAGSAIAVHLDALVPVLSGMLTGRLWDGKEKVFDAIASLTHSAKDALDESAVTKLAGTVLEQCKRKKRAYRVAAMDCLGKVGGEIPHVDLFAQVRTVFEPMLAEIVATDDSVPASASAAEDEEARKRRQQLAKLVSTWFSAVERLWPNPQLAKGTAVGTHREHFNWLFHDALLPNVVGHAWKARLAALSALRRVVLITHDELFHEGDIEALAEQLVLCMQDGKSPKLRAEAVSTACTLLERGASSPHMNALLGPFTERMRSFLPALSRDSSAAVLRKVAVLRGKLSNVE